MFSRMGLGLAARPADCAKIAGDKGRVVETASMDLREGTQHAQRAAPVSARGGWGVLASEFLDMCLIVRIGRPRSLTSAIGPYSSARTRDR